MLPTKIEPRYKRCLRIRTDPWEIIRENHKKFSRKKWKSSIIIRKLRRKPIIPFFRDLNLTLLRRYWPLYLRYHFQLHRNLRQSWKCFYGNLQDFKVKKIARQSSSWQEFVKKHELRLDVLLYRCNLFNTVSQGRQWINHGHVTVNGKKVCNSKRLQRGDIVELDEKLQSHLRHKIKPLWRRLKKRSEWSSYLRKTKFIPEWVDLDTQSLRIVVVNQPIPDRVVYPFQADPNHLVRYYRV